MDINYRVVNKFRMNDVVNYLLDCFPPVEIKKSLFKSINMTIMNIKKSMISGEKNIIQEPDNDFSENPNDIDDLIKNLEKQMNFNEILGNVGGQDNLNNNNNIEKPINTNDNNIENNPPKTTKNRFQDLFNDDTSKILVNTQDNVLNNLNEQNQQNKLNDVNSENKIINVNKDSIVDIIQDITIHNTKIIIPKEPDINNPDVCTIKFASPKSDKIIERRFLKTDKIVVLYNYAQTIKNEILDNNAINFDIVYGYPPISLGNLKEKTLYDEGLSPSSLVHLVKKQ